MIHYERKMQNILIFCLYVTGAIFVSDAAAASASLFFGKSNTRGGGSTTTAAPATAQPTTTTTKRLTLSTISSQLREMQYAVRGKVVITANRIEDELESSSSSSSQKKYNFDKIIYTNIGNPHQMGQKCLTWPRQVMALCDLPPDVGVDHPSVHLLFPKDAVERAREIRKALGVGGTGAYSHSKGVKAFREDIAAFITKRDGGTATDPENIFITNGASSAIGMVITALIADENCGVMIPIPQYPIYSATIDLQGGKKVGYYLDETKGWSVNMKELERSLAEAKAQGIVVTSFVLINPGNPTGQVLSKKAVQDICKFCSKHNLVLLADEVYQENIYNDNAKFVSCKKAASDLGLLDDNTIELISFHSTSKGLFGECGRRGGYMELVGIDDDVVDQIYKLASSGLCSGLPGQIMMSLMVRGPQPGDESYASHESEKKHIFDSLKRRSTIVSRGLDAIPGLSCEEAQGAMYCFPKVAMPPDAVTAAEGQGVSPDTLYALSLLEYAGICVVPADGFGGKEGRFGFRTTFLPKEEEVLRAVDLIKEHHEVFCDRYSS